jgi:hypothetical protein
VLNRYRPNNPFVVFKTNRQESVDYILKCHPSPFWETIGSTFHLSENWIVKKLLDNTYTLDTNARYSPNARLMNRERSGEDYRSKLYRSSIRIIDELFILYDKNRGKCLVYFHAFQSGDSMAILERTNATWKLVFFAEVELE